MMSRYTELRTRPYLHICSTSAGVHNAGYVRGVTIMGLRVPTNSSVLCPPQAVRCQIHALSPGGSLRSCIEEVYAHQDGSLEGRRRW